MRMRQDNLLVKLAEDDTEIRAAQRLRYNVFVEEMGADTDAEGHRLRLERDTFDPFFDHLILVDTSIPDPMERVVGVYRLLRDDMAIRGCGFYSAGEYDLTKIIESGRKSVELGRSCVARDYRGGPAMPLLWQGLAEYVLGRDIQILFGVASFHGRDPREAAHALSYLYYNHLAPEDLRVVARPDHAVAMDLLPADEVDRMTAMKQMPSLIKSYLRVGGFVGQGAYIDHMFNTLDVCVLLDTERMSEKHRKYYDKGRR
jgi:putative hemolysin